MEKKFLKYSMVLVIFFIGLSMGVSYQDNSRTRELQSDLDEFEENITTPNNDFDPVNPTDDDTINPNGEQFKIKNNLFTSIGKDGEYLLKKGISLIINKSDDVMKLIFQ